MNSNVFKDQVGMPPGARLVSVTDHSRANNPGGNTFIPEARSKGERRLAHGQLNLMLLVRFLELMGGTRRGQFLKLKCCQASS